MNQKSGSRTLLMSVVMSAPGPLLVGLGLLTGHSATQLADFVRRSAELAAIVVAFVVYQRTARCDGAKKAGLERRSNLTVGGAMCLSGGAMLLLALLSEGRETGNVLPGLTISILGVIANTLFWRKYAKLSRAGGGAILEVQSHLYRAKALVDICVTVALLTVRLVPGSPAAYWLDKAGSVVVALYLFRCGGQTIRENWKNGGQG